MRLLFQFCDVWSKYIQCITHFYAKVKFVIIGIPKIILNFYKKKIQKRYKNSGWNNIWGFIEHAFIPERKFEIYCDYN